MFVKRLDNPYYPYYLRWYAILSHDVPGLGLCSKSNAFSKSIKLTMSVRILVCAFLCVSGRTLNVFTERIFAGSSASAVLPAHQAAITSKKQAGEHKELQT